MKKCSDCDKPTDVPEGEVALEITGTGCPRRAVPLGQVVVDTAVDYAAIGPELRVLERWRWQSDDFAEATWSKCGATTRMQQPHDLETIGDKKKFISG